MTCIWSVFRAESRRRWASWFALALLVAVVGGTVLAGVSAGRRTAAAFPHFVAQYGFDAALFSSSPSFPLGIADRHDVQALSASTFYFNGNVIENGRFIPSNDFTLLNLPSSSKHTFKLIGGRLPTGPREAIAGFSMQQQYGLHLGSIVTVPLYAPSQRQLVLATNGTPTPHGPSVRFRIVGFEVSMLDFPTTTPSYTLWTDAAFDRGQGRQVVRGSIGIVRLVRGAQDLPRFTFDVNHLKIPGNNFVYVQSEDSQTAAVENSINPQADGWWLFALLAGIAGLALVGQALSRQSIVERESYPTLSAVGFRPNQIFGLGMVRAAAIAVAGTAGALVVAVAVSPLTPVGEARAAEPDQGFIFDSLVFGLGAAAIIVVVVLLAAYPSWRASQVRATTLHGGQTAVHSASRAVRVLAQAGAPPSVLVGTRHALERGRGRASVPVATALFGTIVAVAALAATAVFGASLSNLLDTPRLYGLSWQVDLGGLYYSQASGVVKSLLHDPSVTRVTYGINGKFIDVNGASVQATLVLVGKGPMVFSLIDGRYPRRDGELALGTQTLAAAKAHIGSRVSVAVIGPTGRSRTSEFTVTGTIAFPPNLSQGGLGDGAIVPLHAAAASICPAAPAPERCIESLIDTVESNQYSQWGMAIATAPTAAGRATAASLDRRFSREVSVLSVPTNLVNFGQAVNFPALLGVTLALFGAATLAHLLFVTVARRRREIALLKVLGFVRRQVGTAVCSQATTIAVVGIVIGVPAGIAVGHVIWLAFASNLGAVPLAVVPVGIVAAIVAGVVVVSNLLAFVPAALAARLRPAEALREA
jgi:hypothetical protein